MLINVVNEEGVDLDVLINLRLFYSNYGKVKTCKQIVQVTGDLIVLMRCKDVTSYLKLDRPIHIYDYSKTIDLSCLRDDQREDITVISLDQELEVSLSKSNVNFIHSYHPVHVRFWKHPRSQQMDRRHSLVHIGNYKILQKTDNLQRQFNQYLVSQDVEIFGANWDNVTHNNGPIPFNRVSGLYAKSKKSIGLMYAYQRCRTLSGRMWQGPINGCSVFSEALPKGIEIPGVILVDYSGTDTAHDKIDHAELSNVASDFWENAAKSLELKLCMRRAQLSKVRTFFEYCFWKLNLVLRSLNFSVKRRFGQ